MFKEIITFIGSSYPKCKEIYNLIGSIFSIMLAYKTVYIIIGLLFTRKFKPAKNKHKYAILIAARNEEKVIGNLLESINKQDYDMKKVTTFVVADNCTDNTKKIAAVIAFLGTFLYLGISGFQVPAIRAFIMISFDEQVIPYLKNVETILQSERSNK